MPKKMTQAQAQAYLADTSNFFQNDELCYVCGALWEGAEVEWNSILFCGAKCQEGYARIVRIAKPGRAAMSREQPRRG